MNKLSKLPLDKLYSHEDNLRGLEGRISTASFWDKLKYLFGGCL